jgi:hypothetical protein
MPANTELIQGDRDYDIKLDVIGLIENKAYVQWWLQGVAFGIDWFIFAKACEDRIDVELNGRNNRFILYHKVVSTDTVTNK